MIDSQTKQRIIDAANILEVVQDFVSLRRSGVSYVGLCPFHSDRKPSFYVSPSKNVCKCFSCVIVSILLPAKIVLSSIKSRAKP